MGEFPLCDYLGETYSVVLVNGTTVNRLLSPSGGLFISRPFEGGGAYLRGGSWNRKWKSSSTRRLQVMQPRIRMKSELPVGKIEHSRIRPHKVFTFVID